MDIKVKDICVNKNYSADQSAVMLNCCAKLVLHKIFFHPCI